MAKWLLAASLALASFSGLPGCATTAQGQTAARSTAVETAKIKDEVTVENLLRWPLEGPAGADKAISALRQRFDLQPLVTGDLSGRGPISLGDGYVLSFATTNPASRDIDLGMEQAPCYSPSKAAAASGAVPNAATQDAHGVDRGRTYDAQRNGMRVRFTTTPVTYRCVTSIHVHAARELRP